MSVNNKEFEKSSLMLFVLMMIANVCNYLFQIITGNLLEVNDYGVLNVLISFITLFSEPSLLITIIATKYVAVYKALGEEQKVASIVRRLFTLAIIMSLAIMSIGIITSKMIASYFDLRNPMYIVIALTIASFTILLAPIKGSLQGLKEFFRFGVQNLISIASKLLFSIIFILLGFKIYGILVAIYIGIILSLIYSLKYITNYFKIKEESEEKIPYKEMILFAINTLLIHMCINLMTNGDTLLVKRYFSEYEVGVYSSAMIIGKISMYVANAIVTTLFPMASEYEAKGKNSKPLFIKALIYGGGTAMICAIGMIVMGDKVINILFGPRYTEAVFILPAISILVIPLTFINIIFNYILALNERKVFSISIVTGLVLILISAKFMHESIPQMLYAISFILLIIAIINIIYIVFRKKQIISNTNLYEN